MVEVCVTGPGSSDSKHIYRNTHTDRHTHAQVDKGEFCSGLNGYR